MTPRTGRPIKGAVRVADLERYLVRLTPETRERLRELAARLGCAEYEVVERALVELWERENRKRRRSSPAK